MKTQILAALCTVALGGIEASSDTVPAMAGHGWPTHADTCFGSTWQMMRNNCNATMGSTRLLIIPVQQQYPGYNYVRATVGGNGFDLGTRCQALSVGIFSNNMELWRFTPVVTSSFATQPQTLNLGSMYGLPYTTMHYECNVPHDGGRVWSVWFEN